MADETELIDWLDVAAPLSDFAALALCILQADTRTWVPYVGSRLGPHYQELVDAGFVMVARWPRPDGFDLHLAVTEAGLAYLWASVSR